MFLGFGFFSPSKLKSSHNNSLKGKQKAGVGGGEWGISISVPNLRGKKNSESKFMKFGVRTEAILIQVLMRN